MAKRNIRASLLFWIVICLGLVGFNICVSCDYVKKPVPEQEVVIPVTDTIVEVIPVTEQPVIIEEEVVVEQPSVRSQLIDIFRSQIGVRETGNNSGPEIDMYLASVGLGSGYYWCGAFTGWGYLELDLTIPNGAAWTPNWFPRHKVIPNDSIAIGDVGGIYFTNLQRIAHIVVFEETWDNGKNLITTIEGNTSDTGSRNGDGVYRKFRSKKQIYRSANWIDS